MLRGEVLSSLKFVSRLLVCAKDCSAYLNSCVTPFHLVLCATYVLLHYYLLLPFYFPCLRTIASSQYLILHSNNNAQLINHCTDKKNDDNKWKEG
jgi:hypothetical protein